MSRRCNLDATTREGFLEIAAAFGRERAHESRIAAYRQLYERNQAFRWFGLRWQRALLSAELDRDYETQNPIKAQLLRDAGVGY